jgi:hypothetical protein
MAYPQGSGGSFHSTSGTDTGPEHRGSLHKEATHQSLGKVAAHGVAQPPHRMQCADTQWQDWWLPARAEAWHAVRAWILWRGRLTQGAGCAPGEWLWGSDHWDGVECCGSIDLIVAGGGYFVAGIEASRRGGEATQGTLGEYSGLGGMRLRAAVAVRRQHDQGDDGLS